MLLGEGTVVAFCGRILALSRWNLTMSRCKCPGVPRGQPPGLAAHKCITLQFRFLCLHVVSININSTSVQTMSSQLWRLFFDTGKSYFESERAISLQFRFLCLHLISFNIDSTPVQTKTCHHIFRDHCLILAKDTLCVREQTDCSC